MSVATIAPNWMIAVNAVIMTLFLWHMTAFLLAILTLWPLERGLTIPEALSAMSLTGITVFAGVAGSAAGGLMAGAAVNFATATPISFSSGNSQATPSSVIGRATLRVRCSGA